jgi:hypothetical protein
MSLHQMCEYNIDVRLCREGCTSRFPTFAMLVLCIVGALLLGSHARPVAESDADVVEQVRVVNRSL